MNELAMDGIRGRQRQLELLSESFEKGSGNGEEWVWYLLVGT